MHQVESARADRLGVSFGIDFSGSTNLVLLPSATTSTTLGTTTRRDVAGVADTKEGEGGGGRAKPGGNGEGGEQGEKCDEMDSMHGVDEAEATVNGSHGATVGSRGVPPLSARVSAEAFCRMVLARVAVRDPEATGTIKVSTGKHVNRGTHLSFSCCWGWDAGAEEYVATCDAIALASFMPAEMGFIIRGTQGIVL